MTDELVAIDEKFISHSSIDAIGIGFECLEMLTASHEIYFLTWTIFVPSTAAGSNSNLISVTFQFISELIGCQPSGKLERNKWKGFIKWIFYLQKNKTNLQLSLGTDIPPFTAAVKKRNKNSLIFFADVKKEEMQSFYLYQMLDTHKK